jgi:hypothetical protein
MSFTGDLEHLSIVDVVQLLHATRKSGTLTVTGRKGAAQLVFSDGFIVSANHFDDRLRIGAILVGAGALAEAELGKALAEQKSAGAGRRPLIATLIETGRVKKADAFRGLEALIELTIVDILTWKSGSFTLDVGAVSVADEYRYFPENLREDLHFNTENVLMEALRIYDEKKRDGQIQEAEPAADEAAAAAPAAATADAADVVPLAEEAEVSLSPDDLGLADVDRLERRIPGVFAPIEDRPRVSPHRAALREAAPGLPEEEIEELARFLESPPPRANPPGGLPVAVILLGADALLAHCLAAVCHHDGLALFATTDPEDVLPFAEHQRGKGRVPILALDCEELAAAGLPRQRHPHLGTLELVAAGQPLAADEAGIRAVLARPTRSGRPGTFAPELVRFLTAFPGLARAHAREQGAWAAAAARQSATRLALARDAAAVAHAVLDTVAGLGTRALALIIRGSELVAAGSAGLHPPGAEPAATPGVRISLEHSALLREAVGAGRCLVAPADEALAAAIGAAIGAPADPTVLLVPLAASGRTVSLICADFGAGRAAPPPPDLLETIAAQAAAALELVLCAKKLEKLSR